MILKLSMLNHLLYRVMTITPEEVHSILIQERTQLLTRLSFRRLNGKMNLD